MMPIKIMQMLVDPLEQGQLSAAVKEAANLWSCTGTPKLLRASANFVFRCQAAGGELIIRLSHVSENSMDSLLAEINVLNILSNSGISVPKAVISKNGNPAECVEDGSNIFRAVAFPVYPGTHLEIVDTTPDQIKAWGAFMAKIHSVMFDIDTGLVSRATWTDGMEEVGHVLGEVNKDLEQRLTEQCQWLETVPQEATATGLIHGDFELDNLLWHDGRFTAIDFDDMCHARHIVDIALALRDAFTLPQEETHKIVDRFLEGYCSVRSVSSWWAEGIGHIVYIKQLLTLGRLIQVYRNTNSHKDAPWLANMRKRHEARISQWSEELRNVHWFCKSVK